jgi:hypothetical protein
MATKARVIKKDKAKDGRIVVRADSRPRDATTQFTTKGDSATVLGEGNQMFWDFSNNDDEVTDSITTAVPASHTRKRIKLSFADDVWLKEGTIYWKDAPKGCYIDFWVICPDGEYYINRAGTPTLATADTPITHYVNGHRIFDSCAMGDELNTEGAMEDAMPNNYELWLEVTTPDSDNTSYGHALMELYRDRTHLLPGESV